MKHVLTSCIHVHTSACSRSVHGRSTPTGELSQNVESCFCFVFPGNFNWYAYLNQTQNYLHKLTLWRCPKGALQVYWEEEEYMYYIIEDVHVRLLIIIDEHPTYTCSLRGSVCVCQNVIVVFFY